jgi:putative transposase
MPGIKPPPVTITSQEREQLEKLTRNSKTPQQTALRARIVLALNEGLNTHEIARSLNTCRNTVRHWRTRWLEPSGSSTSIFERLQDAQRPGAPAVITAEQWCQITALACEPPSLSDRPISHWTSRELVDEAIKRQIVDQISERHMGRFLKRERPARCRLVSKKGNGPATASQSRLVEHGT